MKICVGITTYNRLEYVKECARSLSRCHEIDTCSVRIYDDCSTEYELATLQQLFPTSTSITRGSTNVGADCNAHQMFLDFLATGDDVLLSADSDLLFRPDFLEIIKAQINNTDGFLGLYNSALHGSFKSLDINGFPFVEKTEVGAAGSAMSRDIIQLIVDNIPPGKEFDCRWARFLHQKGKRLLVTRDSYIQHMGLHGFNCNGSTSVDFGLNFFTPDLDDQRVMADFFQNLLLAKDKKISSLYRSVQYNLGNAFVLPFTFVNWLFRRLQGQFQR